MAAPLAGISSRPFRVLAAQAGASLTYTEMVSSEGVFRRQSKSLAMMEFRPDERPIGIQLFGSNPEVMHQATQITVRKYQPDLVDINFGCPVRKIVEGNGGAAILKDLSRAKDIIRATVEGAGDTPVTIKIRTGWDDGNPVFDKVGRIAEDAGAKAVTLHARSRNKGFSGTAEWTAIKWLKDSVSIPVIGNGDVKTPQDAKRMLDETGCDGVMIGRAALGDPFIFRRVNHYLATGEDLREPTIAEKIDMARLHARLMIEEFGEKKGALMMRRYLSWYLKGFRGASELRQRLSQVHTILEVEGLLETALRNEPVPSG